MKYKNASKVLPEHLLLEIQQYVQGEYLYIPTQQLCCKRWGEKSGIRKILAYRNKEIIDKYKQGNKMMKKKQMKMAFLLLQCGIGNGKIILLKSNSTKGPRLFKQNKTS